MNFTDEMKQYGETAVEQGKAVVAEARKPLYALVGAGELAVERVRDLAVRARQADPNAVRDQVTKYLQETGNQAMTVYAGLTQRGERLLGELRLQPVVHKVLVGAEEAVDKVEDTLEDLIARGEKTMNARRTPKADGTDEEPAVADDISDAEAAELADEITPEPEPAVGSDSSVEESAPPKQSTRSGGRSSRKSTPKA